MLGFVKYLDRDKRFGFIRNEAGDFYFEHREVEWSDDVEFWLDDSRIAGLMLNRACPTPDY